MYIIDVYVIMYNSQKKIHTCSAGVSVYRESRVLSAYAWLSVLMARTERFGGLGLLPIGATTPWPGPRHSVRCMRWPVEEASIPPCAIDGCPAVLFLTHTSLQEFLQAHNIKRVQLSAGSHCRVRNKVRQLIPCNITLRIRTFLAFLTTVCVLYVNPYTPRIHIFSVLGPVWTAPPLEI